MGQATAIGNVAVASGTQATAVGAGVTASGAFAAAFGSSATASGAYAAAFGSGASASMGQATAIGNSATASGEHATAVGESARAIQYGATAIGSTSLASGSDATALGVNSTASGLAAVALGHAATASGQGASAFGEGAIASGLAAVALGQNATASMTNSIAIGPKATASGTSAIAIGAGAVANQDQATAVGNVAAASGPGASAFGDVATASAQGSAFGDHAAASGTAATALGISAVAKNTNDVALGSHSTTDAPHTGTTVQFGGTAVGVEPAVSTNGVVSVGAPGTERQIQNVAAGVISDTSTDAINGSQLNTVVTGINKLGGSTARTLGGGASYSAATGNITGFSQLIYSVSNTGVVTGPTPQATVSGALAALDANVYNAANIAVKYDAVGGTKITLGATGGAGVGAPVTIANLAPAALNATSTDAVNGSQLFATNQNVTSIVKGQSGPFVSDSSVTAVQPVSSGANASAGGFGASATGASSTVLGNQSTDNGNANATVLGQGASIGAGIAGSNVALGQGSTVTAAAVPTAGTTIGDGTYTFAGTRPVGVVSVGSAGAERQITNVAAGQLSATSTNAVNGSQLFATDTQVTNIQNVVDKLNNGQGIKYFHANSTDPDSTASGADAVAIGGNAQATQANSVALGANTTTTAGVSTPSAVIGGVTYNFAGATVAGVVSVGAAGAERQIQNVAAGQLSATSTDAVNGSQLFATNQQVDANTTAISNISKGAGIKYFHVNSTLADSQATGKDSIAVGPQAVASAADSFAAGTGAQSTSANAMALGAQATASIDGSVAIGSGSVSDRTVVAGSGTIPAGPHTVPFNTSDETLLGAVSFGSTTGNTYRQLINVADGTNAHDAVTVRQLTGALASFSVTPTLYFHANSTAADSLAVGAESIAVGPKTVVNGDNGIGIGNGAIVQQTAPGGVAIGQAANSGQADAIALGSGANATGPQSIAQGANSVASAAGGVAVGSGANSSAADALALGSGASASLANSVAIGAGSVTTVGAQSNYIAYGLGSPQSSVGEVNIGNRKITGVAPGSAGTDAVNVSQLQAVDQRLTTQIQNRVNNNGGFPSTPGSSTPPASTGSNSSAGGNGAVASGSNSTAAGNGSNASGPSSTTLGAGSTSSGNNSVAIGAGSNDGGRSNVVSIGTADSPRQITNVAAGTAPTDGVNVGQLNAALGSANAYTDSQIQGLRRDADGGTASAMAVAGLPQPSGPGKSMVSIAGSIYRSQSGQAIGVSTISENNHWIYKAAVTTNTRNDYGAVIGAGYQW
ncbi:YadA-like family protein [Paraburkholderia megapolitana]|uniref:YadA-like family protein n=1 Tax=Paraburkholderia megapolitana TaxID=420953 RepID=UPI0038BAA847